MRGVVLWTRAELVARRRALAVLALLVALASGAILAAVAGARRGASAVDRLVDRTLPANVVLLPNEPGFDWERIRALPQVAALARFAVADFGLDVPGEASFPFLDPDTMRTIERPVVLEGRLADPDRDDEVVVSETFTSRTHRGVGAKVRLRLYSPAQVDAELAGDERGDPEGEEIEATITGVVRSPWFSDSVAGSDGGPSRGFVVATPALFAHHRASFMGSTEGNYINALVRLRRGDRDIAAFQAAVSAATGRPDIELWRLSDGANHVNDVTDFEARSLLAFAAAALIASVFLVGQSVSRFASGAVADLDVLRSIGASRRDTILASAVLPTGAGLIGAGAGAVAATVASPLFPIGSAGRYEPSPGRDLDVAVVVGGAALIAAAIGLCAVGAAWLALRGRARAGGATRLAAAIGRRNLAVPRSVGARFALDPGRGRSTVPTRPAIVGAVVGVLGTVAALTFANGVHDASTNVRRFGQTYQLSSFLGFNGEGIGVSDEQLRSVVDDPDVEGLVDTRTSPAKVGATSVDVFSRSPIGKAGPAVVVEGRMPRSASEVALAPRTAGALHADVGDLLDVVGGRGTRTMRVSGLAFVPAGPHNDYATGAWTTGAGYDSLFDGYKFRFALIALRDGASVPGVAARLADRPGVGAEPVATPGEALELAEIDGMPALLAVFLVVLAVGAVGHALATSVRRRRHDLAVLRALGFSRRQSRTIVVTQASLLAAGGTVVGLPAGLVLGRALWRAVADATPLQYHPPLALIGLIAVGPVALLVANALAALPSRRAAMVPVHEILRVE